MLKLTPESRTHQVSVWEMNQLPNKAVYLVMSLFGGAVCLVGCAPTMHVPYNPAYVPRPVPGVYDDRDWANVVREYVQDGLVDYRRLAKNRVWLDKYLGLVSVVGPESTPKLFPTPSDRVCYYINVYNACAVRAVLLLYPTHTVYRLDTPSFEHGYFFRVDGSIVSLQRLRDKLEAVSGRDVRVLFCLCSAALGSPPLSEQVYRPDSLREHMRSAMGKMIENSNLLRVAHSRREVYFWLPLVMERDKFIDYYHRTTGQQESGLLSFLLQYASHQARQSFKEAEHYAEKALPFNRSLNDLHPVTR